MRINHNIAALNTYRQLSSNGANASKNMEKLSSGLRINKAADDAAGLAISEKMRGQIRGLDQAQRNSQDGISMLQTADGALQEAQNVLQRMRELAVQASNDTNQDDEREALQTETDELVKQLENIRDFTKFNGQELLKGTIAAETTFQVGANASETFTVAFTSATEGIDLTTELTTLGTLDLETDTDSAQTAITSIDTMIQNISKGRATLGAAQNRLEYSLNISSNTSENLTAAESRIRDVDMAKEMMHFTKNNILSQAAQSMLAQANQQPQGVLQLLR